MNDLKQITLEEGSQTSLLRAAQPLVGRSEKDVLWLLWRLTRQSRTVQISSVNAAKMIDLGESTVRRALRRLEQIGFISRDLVSGRRGQEANEYAILWNEIEIAIDAGRVCEMTDEEIEIARDERGQFLRSWMLADDEDHAVSRPLPGQRQLFGTEDVAPVNLTEPARSNRPSRPGQIDRAGPVKLTEPYKEYTFQNTLQNTPTPHTPRRSPTIFDADWLVVVDEMKIFGIWDEAARKCATEARERGLTPQTVKGLIRFAAGKVIALDNDGRPVAQWRMPPEDLLDLTQPQPNRLYLWGPPMLLARIARHEPHMGIASDWPINRDRKVAYDEAQRRMVSVVGQVVVSGDRAPQNDGEAVQRKAQADALAAERERLEITFGKSVDALPLIDAIALLPPVARASFSKATKDPRLDRLVRLQILRAFAAGGTGLNSAGASPGGPHVGD